MTLVPQTILTLPALMWVGMPTEASVTSPMIQELWSRFIPRRAEVRSPEPTVFYAVEVYPEAYFGSFDPNRNFERWAVMEWMEGTAIPEGMSTLPRPEGLYAKFDYHGPASAAGAFYQQIFQGWLPYSGYEVADRPHFARMGKEYKGNDPDSREEVFLPVKRISEH